MANYSIVRYKFLASLTGTVSLISTISIFVFFAPKDISKISPTWTLELAFPALPLIRIRPASLTSLAKVLRLIKRETFKNLSNRNPNPSFPDVPQILEV